MGVESFYGFDSFTRVDLITRRTSKGENGKEGKERKNLYLLHIQKRPIAGEKNAMRMETTNDGIKISSVSVQSTMCRARIVLTPQPQYGIVKCTIRLEIYMPKMLMLRLLFCTICVLVRFSFRFHLLPSPPFC